MSPGQCIVSIKDRSVVKRAWVGTGGGGVIGGKREAATDSERIAAGGLGAL